MRLRQAYAEGSSCSYYNKFNLLLLFCIHYDLNVRVLTVNNVISFIEMLAYSGLSTATIVTYISAIKTKCSTFEINFSPWSHSRVTLMLRACSRTIVHHQQAKQVLTPHNLVALIQQLSSHPHGVMYKGLFLLAFHGFFRISNLLPKSKSKNETNRHLTRGDVSISSSGITVFLKWSKTMQASRDTRLIPLAAVPGSPLCPLQAFLQIQQAYPVPSQSPMFSYLHNNKLVVISQSQARQVLFKSLSALGLDAKTYGFHTFRRSGASLAFSLNVPVQYIKAHGTWASDAVWAYLHESLYPTVLTNTISGHLATLTPHI